MKKIKLAKIISSVLIAASIMVINPIGASAYSQNRMTGSTKTVYAEGYQWDYRNGWWICGTPDLHQAYHNTWICTNNKWYYVNNDGWMVSNVWVNDDYVGADGAWMQNAVKDASMTGGMSSASTNTSSTVNTDATTTTTNNTNTTTFNTESNINAVTNAKSELESTFPCWLLVNMKYYYINEKMQLEYDTTIDGYKLDYTGAWIEDDSMNKPNVTKVSSSIESLAIEAIRQQSYEADFEKGRQEARQRMQFIRQQHINEYQEKIDKIKSGTISDTEAERIKQYEAKIKELQALNNKDS